VQLKGDFIDCGKAVDKIDLIIKGTERREVASKVFG